MNIEKIKQIVALLQQLCFWLQEQHALWIGVSNLAAIIFMWCDGDISGKIAIWLIITVVLPSPAGNVLTIVRGRGLPISEKPDQT